MERRGMWRQPKLDPRHRFEAAEALGLKALLFLVEDEQRLVRFLDLSGLDPATLRARAGSPEMLAAVIGHLLADESLLLVFTAGAGIAPDEVTRAHALLDGPAGETSV